MYIVYTTLFYGVRLQQVKELYTPATVIASCLNTTTVYLLIDIQGVSEMNEDINIRVLTVMTQ